MNKVNYILLPLLVLIISFFACKKEIYTFNNDTNEVFEIIKTYKPELLEETINKQQIEKMLYNRSQATCTWDFNDDYIIDSSDLITLLQGFGDNYTVSDLQSFLSVYNQVLPIIPMWNNWVQDVNCNLGWDNLTKVKCTTLLPASYDSCQWIFNDEVVSRNINIKFRTYNPDGSVNCEGWSPPCNGTHSMTLKIFKNGSSYERTANSLALINYVPAGTPSCFDFNVPNLFIGNFTIINDTLDLDVNEYYVYGNEGSRYN